MPISLGTKGSQGNGRLSKKFIATVDLLKEDVLKIHTLCINIKQKV